MGELILCGGPLAAMPYYIEEVSLNVYSLEELSYYVEQNLYLLGPDFMQEELCDWVEKELGLSDTAEKLREIRQSGGTLSEFVLCLLLSCGYCSSDSLRTIRRTLQEMEQKSEFECGKIRADRYLEHHKYIRSIYEYRKLLEDAKEEEPALTGAVWHNLGTAYARLFLFDKAAECYGRAYERYRNRESLVQCLTAYRLGGDERGFQRMASASFVGEDEAGELCEALKSAGETKEGREFGLWIAERAKGETGLQEMGDLLEEWKSEYRKNCDM